MTPLQPEDIETACSRLAGYLQRRGLMLATAESCTGGMIAAACTSLSGSSAWFERGFVTYSNEAKTELLGVTGDLLLAHGAVSEPVARAMAQGALARSRAQVSVSVTGVAGPTGGSVEKPVGTVCFAWAVAGSLSSAREWFDGDRAGVRRAATWHALARLVELLEMQS